MNLFGPTRVAEEQWNGCFLLPPSNSRVPDGTSLTTGETGNQPPRRRRPTSRLRSPIPRPNQKVKLSLPFPPRHPASRTKSPVIRVAIEIAKYRHDVRCGAWPRYIIDGEHRDGVTSVARPDSGETPGRGRTDPRWDHYSRYRQRETPTSRSQSGWQWQTARFRQAGGPGSQARRSDSVC